MAMLQHPAGSRGPVSSSHLQQIQETVEAVRGLAFEMRQETSVPPKLKLMNDKGEEFNAENIPLVF